MDSDHSSRHQKDTASAGVAGRSSEGPAVPSHRGQGPAARTLAEDKEVLRLRRRIAELEMRLYRSQRRSDTLREINTLLTSLIESTDDFILIGNARGEPLFFNTAYARLIEEITGEPPRPGEKPHDRLPDPEKRALLDRLHARVLGGEKFRVDFTHPAAGGKQRHFELSYNPVWADGQVVGFTEFTHEVTAHVNAQADRQELREQLLQSQKMEALGKLAGGMAHDFNNLLAVVLGNAELIADRVDDERLQAQANKIARVARRARDLTTKLLAFARREKLETQQVCLAALLDDVLEIIGGSVPRSIQLEVDNHVPDALLEVSLGQVSVALLNIAINAVDAMPAGGTLGVAVREETLAPGDLRLGESRAPGRYCCISFSDTGVGMDEETRLRATEPFFTRKQEDAGTGLGLSVSLGVLEAHGGLLEIESAVGEGTLVRAYLPLVSGSKVRPAVTSPGAGRVQMAARVLVVDDEDEFRATLAEELRALGHQPVTAGSGTEALLWLRDHPGRADLVLLDLMMPGLSGRDTYQEIRKLEPDVPVVLCSGYSQQGDARELLEAGAAAHLQKPFDLSTLGRAIRHVLSEE